MKLTEVQAPVTSGNVPLSAEEQYKKALDLSQPIIKKMINQFPQLAQREPSLIRQVELFLRDSIAIKYLFNQDGTSAVMDGTPKAFAPSAEIEFQKTIGSHLALWALNAGVNIFNSAPDALNSPEEKLRALFKGVTQHFSAQFNDSTPSVMTGILAIHDILKSEKIRETVSRHLGNSPVEINGVVCSQATFGYLDHDTQLLVALHLMKKEIAAGTDGSLQSLTTVFFPAEEITAGRHKVVIPLMETMWGMRLNSLQILQGEIHSVQLIPFLKQVMSVSDTDYLQLKLALKALYVHEVTDLMGAANPVIPVLSESVVTPLLDMFDTLTGYADALREESRTVAIDINKKADDFYKQLLPELNTAVVEKLTLIPGDASLTAMLVRRLSRMCRMGADDVVLLVKALNNLAIQNEPAYTALLDMYGRLDKKIYLYYGPALLENFGIRPPGSEKNLPQLTRALHTLGLAVQQSALEIARVGGEQAFSQRYGTDFINIRPLCLSVWQYLNTDNAEAFDPSHLKLRLNNNSLLSDSQANLPDELRRIYKVSLPDLQAGFSAEKTGPTGHYHVRGQYYVRIGEDYYWVKLNTNGVWALFSQTNNEAKPIPVEYKNNEWQLSLRTDNIDEVFTDFSTHQHFRQWFHTAINTLSLLGARYPQGAEPPAITPAQRESLIKFVLKYFQLQATYSLENTESSLRHPSSPLVADQTYSRFKPTLLYELLCRIKTEELRAGISEIQNSQRAFSAGGRHYSPVEQEFHIVASGRPLLHDEKSGMPKIFDTVASAFYSLYFYGEKAVYIEDLGVQLIRKTSFPSKEGLHKVLSQKGLRMSPNEAADLLSKKMAQWLEAGNTDKVRQILADFFHEKYGAAIADSFKKIELSPNGLPASTSFDPLRETGTRELQALHKLYRQCRDIDKNQLPFYVTQNLEVLQNLIGSDPAAFFTRQTPAMITAEFTDRLQTAWDLMVKIKNEQGIMAPSLASSRMEEFYHTLQNMHHLVRFQMSWNGVQISLEDTLRQLLPDNVRQFAHVTCSPHGISVIRQIHDALPVNFLQNTALLRGLYYETPDLFSQAVKIDSVTDPALKNKKLFILELHANNMSVNHIDRHDPIALLRNVFDGTPSMLIPRTMILDVTANHLTEAEITNVIAAARPYISRGELNLVLVQSAVKFLQNGMDIASAGNAIVLNNNLHWAGFNAALQRTQHSVPTEDKTWLASLLRAENMPLQQQYLDKIRSNTRLLRSLIEPELKFGHNNDNVFQLTVNTDSDTFYLAFRLTDDFIALHTEKALSEVSDFDRMNINHFAFKPLFYEAFKGLALTERPGFGFNTGNLAPSLSAIRFTPGIEEESLIQEYARRILNKGRELYDKGLMPHYLPEINKNLSSDVSLAAKWNVDPVDLQWYEDEIRKKLKAFNPHQRSGESRWIIQLQPDETSSDAVIARLLESPRDSEIIECYQDQQKIETSFKWDSKRSSLASGALSAPAETLKLIIIGHSLNKGENQTFGGRPLHRLQDDLRNLFKNIPYGHVRRLDVDLISSTLVDIHSPETSLPAVLAKTLLEESQKLGINPENISLRARSNYMMVMPNGENHIYVRGQGWVSENTVPDKKSLFIWRYNRDTQEMVPSFRPPGSLGGSSDRIQWTWTPDHLQKFSADLREKLKTPGVKDADESRWVILMQPHDKIVRDAALNLFAKHPYNSALISGQDMTADILNARSLTWDDQTQSMIESRVSSPKGKKLKLIFVGHGPDADSNNDYFGGMSADEWEKSFSKMLSALPQNSVDELHVTLAGCLLVDPNDHEVGLPGRLADILLEEGRKLRINPKQLKLTASEYYVKILPDGKKAFWLPSEKKWTTKEGLIKKGVPYKSTWLYSGNGMVSELQNDRVRLLVRLLWAGTPFHEFAYADQKSILRVLTPEQSHELSSRSDEGRLLFRTLIEMLHNPAEDQQTSIRETPGIIDGHGALGRALDRDGDSLAEVAQKVGVDPYDRAENNRAGGEILNLMQRQGKDTGIRVDSHTRERLGLRARVLSALQITSNGVLTLGAAAALCRLYSIGKRLEDKTLSEEERSSLLVEKRLVTAELSVDITQEFSEFINSKFGMQIARLPAGSVNLSVSSGLSIGTRMTQGLRLFGLSTASVALTVVGTAFAWYGVITAARELHKLSKGTAASGTELQVKISQLRVNLGVNIVTALVSTVLTAGTVVSLVAGIATALKIAGAAGVSLAAGAFMSIAGPVGGAILVAAFVGLWVYNGIKTVEEFSRHIDLNGWDKFLLGAGSIFGYVSDHLQIKYDAEKLKLAVKRAAELEKSGLLESLPEVKAIYQFLPEIVPGEIKHQEQYIDTVNAMPTWTPSEVTPATTYHRVININPDDNGYLAVSADGNQRQLKPDEFIHMRQGREVVTTNKAYSYGAFLTLQGRRVELPNSAFGPNNQNIDSAAVSAQLTAALPQALKDILTSQPESRLFAADEATHLALFCLHEQNKKISFLKFRQPSEDRYTLEFSHTQDLPADLSLQTAAAVLFHDLDGNGLADLVVIHEDGGLAVALQRRNGNFVRTQEYRFWRAQEGEDLSFPWYDGIQGFGGTARTLYSHSSGGTRYSHVILSLSERKAMVSLVNLNRGTGSDEKMDNFIASSKPGAGDFIFHLGGGREKKVRGGNGNDSFVLVDAKTLCKLDGHGGIDTLNFRLLSQDMVSGVVINAREGKAFLKLKNGNVEERVSFIRINNFTGTREDDELTGDDSDNVIDGVSGKDVIKAGAGNDMLRAVSGILDGGRGTDSYDLRRLISANTVDLVEDYSLGEDSHVSLDYRIDEIESILPEDGKHLLITLSGGVKYRLKDFYTNSHAGRGRKTSSFEFTTQDGFRFRLETAGTPPSVSGLSDIPVFFQGSMELENGQVYLNAGRAQSNVWIYETVAGQYVKRTIQLPALFALEFRSPVAGRFTQMTGQGRAERLIGESGARMTGNGGADTYLIEDSPGGRIEINNEDTSPLVARDTLILPWALRETALSVNGNDVRLSHAAEPGRHVRVNLFWFMSEMKFRHLMLRDAASAAYRLDVTGGKVWLASSPLLMETEDRLELLAASEGGLTVDGRSRSLSGHDATSTVIIDNSSKGNWLAGTENAGNYLRVSGGRNSLYGGRLADALYGGSGYDYLAGGEGDDAYYVSGSATLDDTGGTDTLILTGTEGSAEEELLLSRAENSLRIRFKSSTDREVIINDYFNVNGADKKIEYLVMGKMDNLSQHIASLVDAMVFMPVTSGSVVQKQSTVPEVFSVWNPLVASSA